MADEMCLVNLLNVEPLIQVNTLAPLRSYRPEVSNT